MSSYISGSSVTGPRLCHNYHSICSVFVSMNPEAQVTWIEAVQTSNNMSPRPPCTPPPPLQHIHFVCHSLSADPKLSPINVLSFRDQYQQPHGGTLSPYHFLLEELQCIIPGISCNLCRAYPSLLVEPQPVLPSIDSQTLWFAHKRGHWIKELILWKKS